MKSSIKSGTFLTERNRMRSNRQTGRTGWLVTWDKLLCDDMPIPSSEVVCILPPQRGDASITELLRCLWSALWLESVGEKLNFGTCRLRREKGGMLRDPLLRDDRDVDQPFEYGFFYGSKPFLHARKVAGLRVECDRKANTETLHWKEPDRMEWISDTEGARVRHKGVQKCVTQKMP